MMNKIITLLLFGVLSVGCQCAPTISPVPLAKTTIPVLPKVVTQTESKNAYRGDTWDLSLSSKWNRDIDDNVLGLWSHVNNNFKLFLDKRECTSELVCLIDSIRSFTDNGVTVQIIDEKYDQINGRNFTVFQLKKDDMLAMVWLTIVDKHVYVLSCGGKTDYSTLEFECKDIINSLNIR